MYKSFDTLNKSLWEFSNYFQPNIIHSVWLLAFFPLSLNQVTITPRMLLSHLSGIRHYEKDAKKVREDKEKAKRLLKPPEKKEEKSSDENKEKPKAEDNSAKSKEAKGGQRRKKEFEQEEYYLKDNFENVIQALDLFKDDPLIFKPGMFSLHTTKCCYNVILILIFSLPSFTYSHIGPNLTWRGTQSEEFSRMSLLYSDVSPQ